MYKKARKNNAFNKNDLVPVLKHMLNYIYL